MYTYKNKTDQTLVLVGIGTVAPAQTFQAAIVIENPNLELIQDQAAAAQPTPDTNAPSTQEVQP